MVALDGSWGNNVTSIDAYLFHPIEVDSEALLIIGIIFNKNVVVVEDLLNREWSDPRIRQLEVNCGRG